MTTSIVTPGNPYFPRIVGFDMPPAQSAGEPDSSTVMAVTLDEPPKREWVDVFASESTKFRDEHHLSDVRLIGRNLTMIGNANVLRGLSSQVNALIHRVSRQCMDARMLRTSDMSDPASLTPTELAEQGARAQDVATIAGIAGVPGMLEAISRTTGMRFAAIARVTETRWTACAVYDLAAFGLLPGQDLMLESTICNEIRQHGEMVAFDHASANPEFARHPVPSLYGFESYISIPILRQDGSFFGTLCALDPMPLRLDEATITTLKNFALMIGKEIEPDIGT